MITTISRLSFRNQSSMIPIPSRSGPSPAITTSFPAAIANPWASIVSFRRSPILAMPSNGSSCCARASNIFSIRRSRLSRDWKRRLARVRGQSQAVGIGQRHACGAVVRRQRAGAEMVAGDQPPQAPRNPDRHRERGSGTHMAEIFQMNRRYASKVGPCQVGRSGIHAQHGNRL